SEMVELRRSAELRVQELSRRRADFAAKTERRRGLQNDIRRLETEGADLDSRLSRSRMEAIEADEQAIAMRVTLTGATEQLQRLTAQKRLRAVEFERRSAQRTPDRKTPEGLDIELRSLREATTQPREKRAKKEIKKARLSSDLDHLIQSCQTELGENIAEICERLERSRQSETPLPSIVQCVESRIPLSDAGNDNKSDDESLESRIPLSDAGSINKSDDELDEEERDQDVEIVFWQVPDDFDLNAAKTQLEDLRRKIDALGPVNMMALEELSEVEDRFDFLVTQKTDIERAIADTQSAIAEIKRRS